jgi:hypothetical protein
MCRVRIHRGAPNPPAHRRDFTHRSQSVSGRPDAFAAIPDLEPSSKFGGALIQRKVRDGLFVY